jgi:SPP1 family predicted phage head-tail adaptor
MARNEIIELETITSNVDEFGDIIKTSIWKEIFAEKKSIGMQEFYKAHSEGMKPEFKFVIHPTEYNRKTDGPHIRYDGEVFKIIRTYETDSEIMEITVEGDIRATT